MKPNRKVKKPDASSKLILEEIIGLTTKNCNGLASNTSTTKCAYVAGCVVVVYDVDAGTQSHLMVSHRMPKPLSCVAMSRDGRFIAAAESGPQPAMLVWECANLTFISELKGHLYGVECIAFSPDGEHLVSVGGYIYLWKWRNAVLVTKLKANSSCSAITSVTFSSDAKFIVTAGKKHLKFWTIGSSARTRLNKGIELLTIHAKPVNLGLPKGNSFVSVTSPTGADDNVANHKQATETITIYALTDAGVLYLIQSGLSVTKSVDLKVEKGFGLSASNKLIACACSNGAVQLFTIESLKYSGTLHYSMPKKCNVENAAGFDFQLVPTLPDAIACQFSTSEKLVVVYGDHSLYIWDINDVNEATRCFVLVSHSASIWDLKNLCCENMHDPSLACVARGCPGGVSFSTCSADGTTRLWDLALQPDSLEDVTGPGSSNIEPVGTAHFVSAGLFERDTMETGVRTQGFRSMAVSSDGKYLAAGDSEGNLHIYDLTSSDYTCFKDVHDGEILTLSFSLLSKNDFSSEDGMDSHYFLASGGRDRTIHVYDVKRNFDLVETIDDHSAAVTSVKFSCDGCKILSCSADRSLVFRDVASIGNAYKISRCHHQLASLGTVYDMVIDPAMEIAVTVGQDKKINSFNIASGKLIRSLKQDKDFGEPIKVTLDPSGSYLICSYSNKSICLYDFISGEMVTQAMGHGEVITGVIFLPDCKHIVSVGGDGCIFVWRAPARLASKMLQRVKENYGVLSSRNFSQPVALSQIMFCEEENQKGGINSKHKQLIENSKGGRQRVRYHNWEPRATPAFRFSISRLPKWAQTKVTSPEIVPCDLEFLSSQQVEPKNFSPLVGDYASSVHPEIQTPANHGCGDSNSCLSSLSRSSRDGSDSQSSSLPQGTVSSFARDTRWRSVYTVCLDFPNSPEVQILKDVKMSLPTQNLCVTTNKHPCPNNIGFLAKNNDQFDLQNASACDELIADVAEQLPSDKPEVQSNIDANACQVKYEHSDLFKQHFGSLSTTNKLEKRKSTVRQRISAQYVVRRDYDGGCKGLFDTPLRDSGANTLTSGEESASNCTLENPALPVIGPNKQDLNNFTQSLPSPYRSLKELTKCPVEESSLAANELEEAAEKKKRIPERNDVLERITECKKALLNLDNLADSVVQLFSELGAMASSEDWSSGPEVKLYDEAAKLLPSIAEKISEVAKAIQRRNSDLSGTGGTEVSRFEPQEHLVRVYP
ncbi:mitogen-activated protein kinase-binding protein 1 [Pistacia vera]|uniref:mitogen-activated protein kinase-binding protein 1 n=1 Tax=Pistacia vera TaxID=55513 RepID=UPI001262BDE3|nr:mitogen-activated protein kinase-binding protein 1 [Pistacia vera]